MDVDVIRIPVDADSAAIYKTASAQDQQKIQALLSIWLREIGTSDPDSLRSFMDTLSDRAQERGLTPDILDQLLNDE
jgi:hypothetical protein